MDKFYTRFLSMFQSSFGKGWYLTGESLAYFMVNYSLKGCTKLEIEADEDKMSMFRQIATSYEYERCIQGKKEVFNVYGSIPIFITPVKPFENILQEFPIDFDRMKLNFPLNIGERCDAWDINWTEKVPRLPREWPKNVFFDEERKKNGHYLIAEMLRCGEKVGIRDKMFLGFGNVLGYALFGDFCPNDNDIDMCILADDLNQEQLRAYLLEVKADHLTENRLHGPQYINGKKCWVSIGDKSPYTEHGVKACNWFMFEHGGLMWHSKGKEWIGRKDLDDQYITAKGIDATLFKEFKTVNFGGNQIKIPQRVGKCLDEWYGDWLHRRNESSLIHNILVIPNETDKKTWFIKQR